MIFDIKKVETRDLDGNLLDLGFSKKFANLIYGTANTIEWHEIAVAIHKEEEVEMSIEELKTLIAFINSADIKLIAKIPLMNYINELLRDKNNGTNS